MAATTKKPELKGPPISIRLSPTDRKLIEKAAAMSDLKPATFARQAILIQARGVVGLVPKK